MTLLPSKSQSSSCLSSQRVAFVDVAKGLLIILVVFGHAWRAVFNNGILHNAQIYHFIDDLIYAFHMPAFFLLAGLFALKTKKQSVGEFVGKKLRTIVYPYFLWSIIQSLVQLVMSGGTTSTITITDILKIPIAPVMQFWFLYALFFVFLFFILVRQCTASPIIFLVWGLLLFVMVRSNCIPLPLPVIYLANYFIYFAAGIFLAKSVVSGGWYEIGSSRLFGMLFIALIFVSFVPWIKRALVPDFFVWMAFFLAIPGIVLVLAVASLMEVAAVRASDSLSLLGKHSLEIFVVHTICSAGFRIAAFKFVGINNLSIHLIGAVVAGIVCPMFLVYVAERLRWQYLFVWPRS
jgi:fucose 4-O-acetylase-like acetyltransferase